MASASGEASAQATCCGDGERGGVVGGVGIAVDAGASASCEASEQAPGMTGGAE